jgi:plasmid stabilization system protein ParE
LQHLLKAVDYIEENDGTAYSERFEKDIIASTSAISSYPLKYPLDKDKLKNDGSFRAFEILHYRISYRVLQYEIIILRLRHTTRQPLKY